MSKVVIVGGGPAGMLAGVYAALKGHEVHLLEKNEKLGKKLYITGKGRCNVTNACDVQELFSAMESNEKFMYSAFYSYTNQDVMDFFEESGVPLKIERGNRVFPVSDHSSDIIRALERRLREAGVHVHLQTEVQEVLAENGRAKGVVIQGGKTIEADAVMVATGGLSYPATGSTGDGYRFAEETGHRLVEQIPSLVPLLAREDYVKELQGLSLKNTALTIKNGRKTVYEDFGEMMFTHCGVTGPMILSASAAVGRLLQKTSLEAYLDLKPALSFEQLDARILREFEDAQNRQFKNVIGALFPASLTPVMLRLGKIAPEKKIHEISREERQGFVRLVKAFPFTIEGLGSFREAVVTKGGISVKDIQPGTMESRIVKNLYFIGEVLDLDALTGGYNLQIAWSTAYLAAQAVQ